LLLSIPTSAFQGRRDLPAELIDNHPSLNPADVANTLPTPLTASDPTSTIYTPPHDPSTAAAPITGGHSSTNTTSVLHSEDTAAAAAPVTLPSQNLGTPAEAAATSTAPTAASTAEPRSWLGLAVSAPVLRQLTPNHPLLATLADASFEQREDNMMLMSEGAAAAAAAALEAERQALLDKAAQLEQERAAHAAGAAQAEAMRAAAAARAAEIEAELRGEMSARRQQLLQQQEVGSMFVMAGVVPDML
jgi:hypothetical protein